MLFTSCRFLWVELQLERLSHITNEADALAALEVLPLELDTIYEEVLNKVIDSGAASWRFAMRAFQWLLYAKEPLSTDALLSAIASNDTTGARNVDRTSLEKICRNLITLDTVSNRVRFCHLTIQEFLLLRPDFAPLECHRSIAASCLWTCSNDASDELYAAQDAQAELRKYCVLHWPNHYENAAPTTKSILSDQLYNFVFEDGCEVGLTFIVWLEEAHSLSRDLPRGDHLLKAYDSITGDSLTPLFTACLFGLDEILGYLESQEFDWNQKNNLGHTGLYLAAVTGHLSTVEYLISKGADVNLKCGHYGSPMHAACFSGHISIVEKLLEHGADTKCPAAFFDNAFDAAVKGGHEEIAVLLVRNQLEAPARQIEMDSIMDKAGYAGFVKVVNIFQQLHPDQNQNGTAKLIKGAISRGQVSHLQRFLKGRSEPKNLLPQDAVAIAALHGHLSMMMFCIDLGLDIEAEGQFGTPLRSASLMGHYKIVQRLLDLGSRMSEDKALIAASMKGHLRSVQALAEYKRKDRAKTRRYGLRKPLEVAAAHGHLHVLDYLVQAGADIYDGRVALDILEAASSAGHENIVLFLLKNNLVFEGTLRYFPLGEGGEIKVTNFKALRNAARNGHLAVIKLLIKKTQVVKDNIHKQLNDLIALSAENGHLSVLEYLLAISEDEHCSKLIAAESASEHSQTVTLQWLLGSLKDKEELIQCLYRVLGSSYRTSDVVKTVLPYLATDIPVSDRSSFVTKAFKASLRENDAELSALILQQYPGHISHRPYSKGFVSACGLGHLSLAETLLGDASHGFVLNKDIYIARALEAAVKDNRSEIVKLILSARRSYIPRELPHFMALQAAGLGFVEVLLAMLNTENTRDDANKVSQVCLLLACQNGHAAVVRALLENEQAVDVAIGEEEKPTTFTIESDDAGTWLCHLGVDSDGFLVVSNSQAAVKYEPPWSMTSLEACMRGFRRFESRHWYLGSSNDETADKSPHEDTLRQLIDHGVRLEPRKDSTICPLHAAARHCASDVIKLMIDRGANFDSFPEEDHVFLECVKRTSHGADIISILIAAGITIPQVSSVVAQLFDSALSLVTSSPNFSRARIDDIIHNGPGATVHRLLSIYSSQKVSLQNSFETLLNMAAISGDSVYVQLLLDRGVDANAKGGHWGSALHAASYLGHTEVVRILIAEGAEPNMSVQDKHHYSENNVTALDYAISEGHQDIATLLVSHGAKSNNPDALKRAIDSGKIETLANLPIGGTLSDEKQTAGFSENISMTLMQACSNTNLTMVKRLLADGADPDFVEIRRRVHSVHQHGPLHVSCAKGRGDIAAMLISHGASINKYLKGSGIPLHIAASEGHGDIVDVLLENGADIDFGLGSTALSESASRGQVDMVSYLLSRKATIYRQSTPDFPNALAEACSECHAPVVQMLLDELGDSDDHQEACAQAAEIARKKRHADVFGILSTHLNASTRWFSRACKIGSSTAVCVFLGQGFDVNSNLGDGQRALHVAACHLNPDVVEILLKNGADAKFKCQKHGSPILAALEGCAVKYLRPKPMTKGLEQAIVHLPLYESWTNGLGYRRYFYHKHERMLKGKHLSGCLEIIRSLLEAGSPAETECRTLGAAIHIASFLGCRAITELLLDTGACINSNGGYFYSPVYAAIEGDNFDVLELLLDRGADVNPCSMPESRHPRVSLALETYEWPNTKRLRSTNALEKRNLPNPGQYSRGSPLYFACRLGASRRIIELLLQHGADPLFRDDCGNTPASMIVTRFYDPVLLMARCEKSEKLSSLLDVGLVSPQPDLFKMLVDSCSREDVLSNIFTALMTSQALSTVSLQQFYSYCEGYVVTEANLLAAVQPRRKGNENDAKKLETLFQLTTKARITEAVLNTAVLSPEPWDVAKFLLDFEPGLKPSGYTVMALLESRNVETWGSPDLQPESHLSKLWEMNSSIHVTEEMLSITQTQADLRIILSHLNDTGKITSSVMDSIASTEHGLELTVTLLQHKPDVSVQENIIGKLIEGLDNRSVSQDRWGMRQDGEVREERKRREDCFAKIFNHFDEPTISEATLSTALTKCHPTLLRKVLQHFQGCSFSGEVLIAATESDFSEENMRILEESGLPLLVDNTVINTAVEMANAHALRLFLAAKPTNISVSTDAMWWLLCGGRGTLGNDSLAYPVLETLEEFGVTFPVDKKITERYDMYEGKDWGEVGAILRGAVVKGVGLSTIEESSFRSKSAGK